MQSDCEKLITSINIEIIREKFNEESRKNIFFTR